MENNKIKDKKKYHYITEADRYKIEVLLEQKYKISEIAKIIGIHYQTAYKEIKRGKVIQRDSLYREFEVYKADYAQRIHDEEIKERGRNYKIGYDYEFVDYVENKIVNEKYSPEATIMQMQKENKNFKTKVCIKTIYNYIHQGLFLELNKNHLPYKKREKKEEESHRTVALHNLNKRSIDERAKEIYKRETIGHWEMDTVVSGAKKGKSCLLVFTERKTRKEMIKLIPDKKADSVVKAIDRIEKKLGKRKFRETFKTITCDNGVEFMDFDGIQKNDRTILYYCHPYCSSERGSNENANKLIRRFLPKGTNLDTVTHKQIQRLENWINNYPRKLFNGLSSLEYEAQITV